MQRSARRQMDAWCVWLVLAAFTLLAGVWTDEAPDIEGPAPRVSDDSADAWPAWSDDSTPPRIVFPHEPGRDEDPESHVPVIRQY